MTVAVCLNCGEYKVGAFSTCPRCGTAPETAEDKAGALAFTDHYLSPEQLAQASQQVAAGQPVKLDTAFYQALLHTIRQHKPPPKTGRRPWWKFW